MRLIDAYELKSRIRKDALDLSDCDGCTDSSPENCWTCFTDMVEVAIHEAHVFDAEQVRHGRWIKKEKDDFHFGFECSVCKIPAEYPHSYCQYCGAKMDLEAEQ